MNPKVKRAWVAALRSGKYKQGRNNLRPSKDTFCCLGVLCNLHAAAHPRVAATQISQDEYLGESTLLPLAVQSWAGLYSCNPMVDLVSEHGFLARYNLAELNDFKQYSFKKIADIIEEQL